MTGMRYKVAPAERWPQNSSDQIELRSVGGRPSLQQRLNM